MSGGVDPWLELARRALVHLPYRRLRQISEDHSRTSGMAGTRDSRLRRLRWFGVAPPRPSRR